MKIYNYSKETKQFVKESTAKKDPMEKGKFLIPANSTTKKSLKTKKDEVCVFNKKADKWEVKVDYRGIEYYDTEGSKYIIDNIGEEVPEYALNKRPIILEEERQKRINSRKSYLVSNDYISSKITQLQLLGLPYDVSEYIDRLNKGVQARKEINEIEIATEKTINNYPINFKEKNDNSRRKPN